MVVYRETFAEALLIAIASDLTLIPESYRGEYRGGALEVEDPATGARYRVSVEAIDPPLCGHGINEGDYCPRCNAEYKRARIANGLDGDDLL